MRGIRVTRAAAVILSAVVTLTGLTTASASASTSSTSSDCWFASNVLRGQKAAPHVLHVNTTYNEIRDMFECWRNVAGIRLTMEMVRGNGKVVPGSVYHFGWCTGEHQRRNLLTNVGSCVGVPGMPATYGYTDGIDEFNAPFVVRHPGWVHEQLINVHVTTPSGARHPYSFTTKRYQVIS